jgi:hypothetical protein
MILAGSLVLLCHIAAGREHMIFRIKQPSDLKEADDREECSIAIS